MVWQALDNRNMIQFDSNDIAELSGKPLLAAEDPNEMANPPKDVQEIFVGASFENAYGAAAQFLNYLFGHAQNLLPSGLDGARILDFGCGWGRMLRLIRHKPDLDVVELYGCDVDPNMVELCRRSLPRTHVAPSELFPPLIYRTGFLDVVYANSVFSHLGEMNHVAWAQEFARVVRPQGLVVVTTQAKHFLSFCEDLRTGKREIQNHWHKNLSLGFTDPNSAAKYDAGEFLYAPQSRGANPKIYGEAIVPRQFFEEHWGGFGFDLVDWFEHPDILGQNRAVLRRRNR